MSKVRGRRKAGGKADASAKGGNAGQFKPGQSGNPGGRRKGLGRMVTESFVADFFGAWAKRGQQAIEDVIVNYPDVGLYTAASLVPKDITTKSKPLIDDNARLAARILAAGADVRDAADGFPPPEAPHASRPGALCAPSVDCPRAEHAGGASTSPQGGGGIKNRSRGRETNLLASYRPYPPQAEFHEAGAVHDERLLMAGNQLGKTLAGAMEWAMHLTGRYPDWWKGKVFDHPVRMWAAGVTAESTRDNPQRVLMGPPQLKEKWVSGTIPKDAIK
jgi:hypothetical protein